MRRPWLFIFLFLYIIVFTFGLLNMIVAVVVEKTLFQARRLDEVDRTELKRQQLRQLETVASLFEETDANDDGVISKEEFQTTLKENETVCEFLACFGFPIEDIDGMWNVFNCKGNEGLTVDDVLLACLKVREGATIMWDVSLTVALIRRIQRQMDVLQTGTRDVRDAQKQAEDVAAARFAASRVNTATFVAALQEIDAKLDASIAKQEQQSRIVREQSDEQAKVLRSLLDVTERLRTLEEQQRSARPDILNVAPENALLQTKLEEPRDFDVPESDAEAEEEQSRAQTSCVIGAAGSSACDGENRRC